MADVLSETIYKMMASGFGVGVDAVMKCQSVLQTHKKVLVSISGGADSDVMLDLIERVRTSVPDTEIVYRWSNTGLEYDATRRHLDYLEQKYGIEILRVRPRKVIPTCCREYGQPFMSKMVSEQIERLQTRGFKWEDEPLEELVKKYPDIRSALRWWTNDYARGGRPTHFDINNKRMLKEFMIENPPWFKISPKCCKFTKKMPVRDLIREGGFDINLFGVRKVEGGVRAVGNSCMTKGSASSAPDAYRPLFWFQDEDRAKYDQLFNVVHSDCYTVWGFKRTGCAGCPFNMQVEDDLVAIEKFEPNLHKAICTVFKDSYEYTRMFYAWRKEKMSDAKGQMALFS